MEQREELLSELAEFDRGYTSTALKLENRVTLCWIGTVTLAALASVIGLIPFSPPVPGWAVSLIAGAASGLEWLRRTTHWRALANIHHALAFEAREFAVRLKREMPNPPSADQIARISKEWREAQDVCIR